MPPTFLCDEAKVEWDRVAPMLYALRLLSELDVAALSAYCHSYAMWRQATTALNNVGLVAKGANGSSIAHPLLKIANKAAQDMVRYAAEFGMTPSARARIHPGAPEDTTDSQNKYFGGPEGNPNKVL
jgi:P27 family predicted phage terminase small subunit